MPIDLKPKEIKYFTEEQIQAYLFTILDAVKDIDPDIIKAWVKESWPEPDDIYGSP